MGGDYNDRPVVQSTLSKGYSNKTSKVVGIKKKIHLSLDPNSLERR